MPEKTMKPTSAPETKGSESRVTSGKAQNEASSKDSTRGFGEMEAKNPNSLGPQFVTKRRTNQDGGYQEYDFIGPAHEDALFKEVSRVLGLGASEEAELENVIADITRMAATWTQSDRYDDMGAFIRQVLRRVSSGNSVKARTHTLYRKLQEMWAQEKGKNE